MIFKFVRSQQEQVREWCRGRNGYARIPLWLFFAYIFIRHVMSIEYQSIIYPLNLGIHELGHLIFSFAGPFFNTLGGSLVESLAPIVGMWNFYVQEDYFALTMCFGWYSTALFSVARYVDDARAMKGPLVSPFGAGEGHDWNYLLGQMGLLSFDHVIAGIIWWAAILSMTVCLVVGGWIILSMIIQPHRENTGGKYRGTLFLLTGKYRGTLFLLTQRQQK